MTEQSAWAALGLLLKIYAILMACIGAGVLLPLVVDGIRWLLRKSP